MILPSHIDLFLDGALKTLSVSQYRPSSPHRQNRVVGHFNSAFVGKCCQVVFEFCTEDRLISPSGVAISQEFFSERVHNYNSCLEAVCRFLDLILATAVGLPSPFQNIFKPALS